MSEKQIKREVVVSHKVQESYAILFEDGSVSTGYHSAEEAQHDFDIYKAQPEEWGMSAPSEIIHGESHVISAFKVYEDVPMS